MPQRNKSTGRQPGGRSAFCARRDKKMPPERPWKTAKMHLFARTKSSPPFQGAPSSMASRVHASVWSLPKNWKQPCLHRTPSCQLLSRHAAGCWFKDQDQDSGRPIGPGALRTASYSRSELAPVGFARHTADHQLNQLLSSCIKRARKYTVPVQCPYSARTVPVIN